MRFSLLERSSVKWGIYSFFTPGGFPSVPRGAADAASSLASSRWPSGPPCYQELLTPVVPTAASGHEVGAPVFSPPSPRASGSFSTPATTQHCSLLPRLGREGLSEVTLPPSQPWTLTNPSVNQTYEASLVGLPSFRGGVQAEICDAPRPVSPEPTPGFDPRSW